MLGAVALWKQMRCRFLDHKLPSGPARSVSGFAVAGREGKRRIVPTASTAGWGWGPASKGT